MLVNVNMSREVANYYKGYDLDSVVDIMLEMYDITNMPPITSSRELERKVNVNNELYLSLRDTYGARSKKISLARLLEFGFNTNILENESFKTFNVQRCNDVYNDPVPSLLERAYKALLDAAKHYTKDDSISSLATLVGQFMRTYQGGNKNDK